MATITSYDAKDCSITWNGTTLSGLGEDMVTGEKDEEMFSTSVGAQGDVIVNTSNHPIGTVTVNLQATSPHVKTLIANAKAKLEAPLWVNNTKLGRKFGGTKARIKNYPQMELNSEASDCEFEFAVFDYEVT